VFCWSRRREDFPSPASAELLFCAAEAAANRLQVQLIFKPWLKAVAQCADSFSSIDCQGRKAQPGPISSDSSSVHSPAHIAIEIYIAAAILHEAI